MRPATAFPREIRAFAAGCFTRALYHGGLIPGLRRRRPARRARSRRHSGFPVSDFDYDYDFDSLPTTRPAGR